MRASSAQYGELVIAPSSIENQSTQPALVGNYQPSPAASEATQYSPLDAPQLQHYAMMQMGGKQQE